MKGLSPVQSASETDQISGIAPRTAKAHRRSMAQVIAMPPPAVRDDLPTRIARRLNALTVAELAELLHVSANHIYDLTGAVNWRKLFMCHWLNRENCYFGTA